MADSSYRVRPYSRTIDLRKDVIEGCAVMKRRLIALLFLWLSIGTAFLPATTPVKAGAQLWSAWMFNHSNGQLMLLTDVMNGTPQAMTLPKLPGFDDYSWQLAVSHDWNYIAYTTSNTATGRKAFMIYKRDTNSALVTLDLQVSHVSLDFHASEAVFNETSANIAFAYTVNNETGWKIEAMQIGTSAPELSLTNNSPAAKALNLEGQFMLPVIRRYVGSEVTFQMVRIATEGEAEYKNYTWNTANGQVRVEPIAQFPTFGTDLYLPTGETVAELVDPRLPSCGGCGPYYVANALSVYDPTKKTRYPFYSTTELAMYQPLFVQGGERILFGGNGPIDSNTLPKWGLVERSGKLVGYLPSSISGNTRPIGWQDGFMTISSGPNPGDPPRLNLVNTRAGLNNSQVVWTGTPGAQVILLQTPSNMQLAGPFPAWGQLAAPGIAPTMTVAPPSAGVLAVGKNAVVNTTEGDKLRVRSGPGTSFGVLTMLAKGTVVTLLEGPRNADGLTWWRVRPPDGIEGWVIEGVTDKGVFIQTLIPQ
jgi:hypothetical protein